MWTLQRYFIHYHWIFNIRNKDKVKVLNGEINMREKKRITKITIQPRK